MSGVLRILPGLLLAACAGGTDFVQLMDAGVLRPVAAEEDPLVQHRPDAMSCPEGAWGPEAGGFEVQTGVCNYAAFAQPLPVDLEPSDQLDIRIWHDTLDAAEPGTGHVAVLLGDQVIWEQTIDIPAASAELGAVVDVPTHTPKDTRLGVHLHNHGYNSWQFFAIDLLD